MFLRNAWYTGALSSELGDKPLGRILLNEPVVLYRGKADTVVAQEDRCPHRRAPLSLGKVVDGNIQCGYHGLTYNASGKCVKAWQQDTPPSQDIRVYPAIEKQGLVWIWMGNPDECDFSTAPHMAEVDVEDEFDQTSGYVHYHCSYRHMIENLLDGSHTQFVHPETFATSLETITNFTDEVIRGDGTVRYERYNLNNLPMKYLQKIGLNYPMDHWEHFSWELPSKLRLCFGSAPLEAKVIENPEVEKQNTNVVYYLLTPETETSHHYFFLQNRRFNRGDKDFDKQLLALAYEAFEEDKVIMEAQQKTINMNPDAPTINLVTDKGHVAALNMLDRAIKKEKSV